MAADPTMDGRRPATKHPARPLSPAQAAERHDTLVRIYSELLAVLDPEPSRPGLKDTPERCAHLWEEFLDHDPGRYDTRFQLEAQTSGDLTVVSGITVWSYCEHHIVPFVADVTIGYLPDGHILGLSKFGRIAEMAASHLQVQEVLVAEIADWIVQVAESDDVAVVARGVHLCAWMRGVRKQVVMKNAALRGKFRVDFALRSEFYFLTEQVNPLMPRGLPG
jgi:GTP cyclohydrolase I